MIEAWRITKRRYSGKAFDGEGARLYGGRWNSVGRAVVYASETRALGMLEVLTGLQGTTTVVDYVAIPVRFDETLVTDVTPDELPDGWDARPPGGASQRVGDAWLDTADSPVLRVPSVVVPAESNFLINPVHPGFAEIEIGSAEELNLDPRFLRH